MAKVNPLSVQLAEGLMQKGDNQLLDKTTWQVGKFTVTDNNKFAYIIINKTFPAMNKKLSETKGTAITDYQNYLETTWLNELRKKYPVIIHEEPLKKMLQK